MLGNQWGSGLPKAHVSYAPEVIETTPFPFIRLLYRKSLKGWLHANFRANRFITEFKCFVGSFFGGELSYRLAISKAANIFAAPGRVTRLLPVGIYITLL